MAYDVTEDLDAFRAEVRDWLEANCPPSMRTPMTDDEIVWGGKRGEFKNPESKIWLDRMGEKGWTAPEWPAAFGGGGLTKAQNRVLQEELRRIKARPALFSFGLWMFGPALLEFGNEEQKKRFLPDIVKGKTRWCQGYSEPGAGSDLAGLQTRCEDKGDHYLINGQKVWSSYADQADWIFCLVRTKKGVKAQEGISFIIFPMTLPGISVSALPTLDMPVEGQQEVNQVFFEDVRVPIEGSLVGKENEGWTYAKYLLQFERGNSYAPGLRNMLKKAKKIASAEQAYGEPLIRDADFARKVAALEMKIDSMDATEQRIFSSLSAGQAVGPESSMLKCQGSETQQEITELLVEAVGAYGAPFVRDSLAIARQGANVDLPMPDYAVPVTPSYFNYRKTSIYAGSNEIQRNIMAKMVLGL